MSLKRFFLAVLIAAGLPLFALDGWLTDYDEAAKTAKQSKKQILALFTGSDWCPYCKYLERDVLSTKYFAKEAPKKYVLLYVDFPRKGLSREQAEKNQQLLRRFAGRCGFPTVLIISPDDNGKVLGKFSGFRQGTPPEEYLKNLERISSEK